MKKTPYVIKAQRARKAWKRLKEQTRTNTIHSAPLLSKDAVEYRVPEMVIDN